MPNKYHKKTAPHYNPTTFQFVEKWHAVLEAKTENDKKNARAQLAYFLLNDSRVTNDTLAKLLVAHHNRKWHVGKIFGIQALKECFPNSEQNRAVLAQVFHKASAIVLRAKFETNQDKFLNIVLNLTCKYSAQTAFAFLKKVNANETFFDHLMTAYHHAFYTDYKFLLPPSDYQLLLERCSYRPLFYDFKIPKLLIDIMRFCDHTNIHTCIKKMGPFLFAVLLQQHYNSPTFGHELNEAINSNPFLTVDEKSNFKLSFSFFINMANNSAETFKHNISIFLAFIKSNDITTMSIEDIEKYANIENLSYGFKFLKPICNYLTNSKNIAAELQMTPTQINESRDLLYAFTGKMCYARFEKYKNHPEFILSEDHIILEEPKDNYYKAALRYWYHISSPKNLSPEDNSFIAEILLGSTTVDTSMDNTENLDTTPTEREITALQYAHQAALANHAKALTFLRYIIHHHSHKNSASLPDAVPEVSTKTKIWTHQDEVEFRKMIDDLRYRVDSSTTSETPVKLKSK